MQASPSDMFPPAGERAERRKVRKGTQSCWECKRRKIRCKFAAPQDATCDGCKRRKTSCISQEFPDVATSTGSTGQVEDRLGRVEALVEQLATSANTSGILNVSAGSPSRQSQDLQGQLISPASNSPYPNGPVPIGDTTTPRHSDLRVPLSLHERGYEPSVCAARF